MNRKEMRIADLTARVFEFLAIFIENIGILLFNRVVLQFIRRRVCETQFVMMNRSSLSRTYIINH